MSQYARYLVVGAFALSCLCGGRDPRSGRRRGASLKQASKVKPQAKAACSQAKAKTAARSYKPKAASSETEATCTEASAVLGGQPSEIEMAGFNMTNQYRAEFGVPPLTWNNRLGKPHSCTPRDDGRHRGSSNTSSSGVESGGAYARAGLPRSKNERKHLRRSEAIRAVRMWRCDKLDGFPAHRANILDPQLTELGVGVLAETSAFGWVWYTQDFGRPLP